MNQVLEIQKKSSKFFLEKIVSMHIFETCKQRFLTLGLTTESRLKSS